VGLLYTTDPLFLEHDAGRHHPERPSRLRAVEAGIEASGVQENLVRFEPVEATEGDVQRVHPGRYLEHLEALALSGGGHIDADTAMGPRSYDAALLAAGAGLEAVRRLDAGEGSAAFCAVRPPGHHATPARAMGFCLINNVAVTAGALAARGERVLIVDYDAHHGNGTQDAFYADDRVTYISLHQYPMYPGTGALAETGEGAGVGTTVNVPLPAGATGDVFRYAIDELVLPFAAQWKPTWLLVSAGFDAHRRDPLTDLGLTSGDYADLTRDLTQLVPDARTIVFLEGGYDLEALRDSTGALLASLSDAPFRPEPASADGPGRSVVDAVRRLRDEVGWA
jgi:acetoin utilization deacetylase AcuC-like enzyme